MSRRPSPALLCASGCFLGTLASVVPVINSTFGLFLLPVSHELHWKRATVSLILVALALSSAVCFPVAGRLADRWGARRVIVAGAVLFPAAVAALALLGTRPAGVAGATVVLFALLGVAATLPAAPLFARLLSGWFAARRGLALGLVAGGGNGVGCVLMPLLAGAVIAWDGWRAAYGVLAATAMLIGLPAALLLLRDPPRAPSGIGPDATGLTRAEAMRTPPFWLLLTLLALGAGSLTAIFTHVAPILLDRGLSPVLATAAVSVVALSGSCWQPAMGALLDRTGDPRWLIPGFLLALPGMSLLSSAGTPFAVLAGATMIGVAIGSDYGAIPLLVGRYFGLRWFGAISGVLYGVNSLALGVWPFLADWTFDRTGGYRPTLIAVSLCLVLCAGCCLALPRFRDDGTDAAPSF